MLWVVFAIFVTVALLLDLGVFRRKSKAMLGKQALFWSMIWVLTALLFGVFIYFNRGPDDAVKYLTGYVVEKGLSIDNIFIFIVIFSFLKIDSKYQHRILFYGVLGAFFTRLIFILLGSYLVSHFSWTMYVFGALLVFLAIQLLRKGKTFDPHKSIITRTVNKIIPIAKDYKGKAFFIRQKGILYATPIFLALILVEVVDVIAAMDSIPAIFVITSDPFIVYTSNIFAVLGLRSLYFVVENLLKKMRYLEVGLAGMLLFLGIKTLTEHFYKLPDLASLAIIMAILGTSIICSLRARR